MKTVTISYNFNLEQHQQKLQFQGNLPLVIIYCRESNSDKTENSIFKQMSDIYAMLAYKFGWAVWDSIWVLETDSGNYDEDPLSRPGFALAIELIEHGYGQYFVVHRLNRITRSVRTFHALLEKTFRPHNIEVLIACKPRQILRVSEKLAHLLPGVDWVRNRGMNTFAIPCGDAVVFATRGRK